MARISLLFIALSFFIAGCQESAKKEKAVETTVKADSNFPAFLVGIWKSTDPNQYPWGFKIEKDGTISALRNFLNLRIEISEGGAYEQTADANVDAASTLGPVSVNYDPNSRVLTVKVITDYFMFHVYDQMLEGSSVDIFTGPVSQDGSTWTTEWRGLSQLSGIPPLDPNDPSINPVTFRKIKEEQKPVIGD